MNPAADFFRSISLETTVKGTSRFVQAAGQIPADALINLAYIGTDSLEERLQAIDALRTAGLRPRPIVSARRMRSAAELEAFLEGAIRQRGLRRLFVVGGDPHTPVGPFEGALALIRSGALDALPLEGVCLPGHPEGHPVIPAERLMEHLCTKAQALTGRGFAIDITTQICLDPVAVVDWIGAVRAQGIEAPIRVGVPSPCTVADMLRFCRLCRVEASAEALARHGWLNPAATQQIDPSHFIATLLDALATDPARGRIHLHLFPMTALPDALAWFSHVPLPARHIHPRAG